MQNIILHLDMNSFFASCEQQDCPAWRGRPVGVCEHLGGIIIAASVQAKRWGITTGTPVWEAKKLYPKIILTHTRPKAYRLYNQKLVKLVGDYTDSVEVSSIDEVFLDITASCNIKYPITKFSTRSGSTFGGKFPNNIQLLNFKNRTAPIRYFLSAKMSDWTDADPWQEAVRIVREIKQRMKTAVGDYLTCSIGIAGNKLLAKIASNLQKPDGLVVITEDGNAKITMQNSGVVSLAKNDLYDYLKLTDVPGIGKRQGKNLNCLGIQTLRDLKNYPKSRLVACFGPILGHHLHSLGQLSPSFAPEVKQGEEIKSMGHMYTLPAQFREENFFLPVLYKLAEMVGRRLRRQSLMGNVIYLYATGSGKRSFGKSKRLNYFVWDGREIFLAALALLGLSPNELFVHRPPLRELGPVKLIGITVGNLQPFSRQLSLFGEQEALKRLASAMDRINQKYGDFTVLRAAALPAGKVFRDSIGFGRIRESLD